jgi:hypothetical protein
LDSTYQFTIGKPGQAAAESRFSVSMGKKDHGYLLREADGKFNLFDLQSLTLLQPVAAAGTSGEPVAKRTDAFTVLLAQAANDPSLLEVRTASASTAQSGLKNKTEATSAVAITTKENDQEPETSAPLPQAADAASNTAKDTNTATDVVAAPPANEAITKQEPKAQDSTQQETITDTAQQTVAVKEEQTAPQTTPEEKPYKPSVVTRKSESSTSEGFGLVFLDATEAAVDTIRILIPNQSFSYTKDDEGHEDSKKFLDISNVDTAKTTLGVDEANDKLSAAKKSKSCKAEATDKDFTKLRKNMTAKESDDAMIGEAQKFFKKSCFSTNQIRNLSALFLSASGKYHFFDAAYGHVSDQEQYAALQSELNDTYYVNRFKALIAKQ